MLRTLTLAFALLAATAPAQAQPQSQAGPRYVSMGSSYAAGLGIAPYQEGAPTRCTRSTRNYASQLAAKRGLTLVDVGCSGAKTSAILQPWGRAAGPDRRGDRRHRAGHRHHRRQRHRPGRRPLWRVVPPEGRGQLRASHDADRGGLRRAEDRPWRASSRRSANGRRRPGSCWSSDPAILPPQGVCAAAPLAEADADAARTKAARLLSITREAAAAGGASVIAASELSAGHDACAAQPWMNGYPAPGAAPYHPNLAAMTAIAEGAGRGPAPLVFS
ncbi:hypothetical protein ACRAWD_13405 [Caulobacter segnis]